MLSTRVIDRNHTMWYQVWVKAVVFSATLFFIMVNDLSNIIRDSGCLLFTDDFKLFLPISNVEDYKRYLQYLALDINWVLKWSKTNKLQFNNSKCTKITFTRTRNPIRYRYRVDTEITKRVTKVRDLRLMLTADLTFRDHITNIC